VTNALTCEFSESSGNQRLPVRITLLSVSLSLPPLPHVPITPSFITFTLHLSGNIRLPHLHNLRLVVLNGTYSSCRSSSRPNLHFQSRPVQGEGAILHWRRKRNMQVYGRGHRMYLCVFFLHNDIANLSNCKQMTFGANATIVGRKYVLLLVAFT
jgi:hypothetical protein